MMAEGVSQKRLKTTGGTELKDMVLRVNKIINLPFPWDMKEKKQVLKSKELSLSLILIEVEHKFTVAKGEGGVNEIIFKLTVDKNEYIVVGYVDESTAPVSFVALYYHFAKPDKKYEPHPEIYLIHTLVPLVVLGCGWQYVAENMRVAREFYGRPPRLFRKSKSKDDRERVIMVSFKDRGEIALGMAETELKTDMTPKEYDAYFIWSDENRKDQREYWNSGRYPRVACLWKDDRIIGAVGMRRKEWIINGDIIKGFDIMGIHSNVASGSGVAMALIGHLVALAEKENLHMVTPDRPVDKMREILHIQHGAIELNDNRIGVPTAVMLDPYRKVARNVISLLFNDLLE